MVSDKRKHILRQTFQYTGAVALIACTALIIAGFRSGSLPFMDDDYLEAVKEAEKEKPEQPTVEEPTDTEVSPPPVVETADTFISGLDRVGKSAVPSEGVYGSRSYLALRSLSELSLADGAELEVHMGYLTVKEDGKVAAVYDRSMKDVTALLNGCTVTCLRDASGRPVFTRGEEQLVLDNGALLPAEYDALSRSQGIDCETPYYYVSHSEKYKVFEENGKYGLLRTEDGETVIPAEYAAVYGESGGFAVAVGSDRSLYLYSADGELINGSYLASEVNDGTAVGYYFVKDGLTRACTEYGEEVVLRTDGSVFALPSGYKVAGYSDGALLLKGENGCGFMGSNGRWICDPDYADALPFCEGLAVVKNSDGLYGMIDLAGNTVIPCLFERLSSCSDGVIVAYTSTSGYCLINKLES